MAIHFAEIEALAYLSNFVAKPAGDQRRLRVIEDDALFAVKQAGPLVDPGDDRIETEERYLVGQDALFRVEGLALPSEDTDEFSQLGAEPGSRRDDGGALRFSIRNRTGWAAGVESVKLRLQHLQQLVYIRGHLDRSPLIRICESEPVGAKARDFVAPVRHD